MHAASSTASSTRLCRELHEKLMHLFNTWRYYWRGACLLHTEKRADQYRHKGCFAITACALSNFSPPTKIPGGHRERSADTKRNERNKKQFPHLVQKLRKAAGGSHTHAAPGAHTQEKQGSAVKGVCFADLRRADDAGTKSATQELELARES